MASAGAKPPIVIDNGTGWSKIGYAGNVEPSYLVESAIGTRQARGRKTGVEDLDFYVGTDAMGAKSKGYDVSNPLAKGQIEDWDSIEKYWQRCLFQYMRCDPEEHVVVLTEPPLNPPENREACAEIMFETFNVPGLYIGVQAVMALIASIATKGSALGNALTGTVIDSGAGVTHVIPVVDGYVIGSCMSHVDLAGSNITQFIVNMLRNRGETKHLGGQIPPHDIKRVADEIKSKHGYVCQDMKKEFGKYDKSPDKFNKLKMRDSKTGAPYEVDCGYEQFLGPELFFNPEIFSDQFTKPLGQVVDECIQGAPVDCRLKLYTNIALSGGSTMFKNFGRRLERDIKKLVKAREAANEARAQIRDPSYQLPDRFKADVKVVSHKQQRFAVWYGASVLAAQDGFASKCISRQRYLEEGPRVARATMMDKSL